MVVKRAQPERGWPRYEQRSETHWWACLPAGRRTYLGRTTAHPAAGGEQGETYNGFRFAGRFLAFHQRRSSNYGNEKEEILEADLRTGRRVVLWAVTGEPLSIPHVVTSREFQVPIGLPLLAVDAQGEVAWVIRDGHGTRMVLVHNRLGTNILASYPRADAEPTITDLMVSNGEVSWIYNGMKVTTGA